MMQTSTIYDRLRREDKEEPKRTCISALAFVQLLPHTFTTAVANKLGEEMGIKERAVRHHLRTLCVKGYIERLRQGAYRKVTRRINKEIRQTA
jgi:predicted ArsR family transcriptional regulator